MPSASNLHTLHLELPMRDFRNPHHMITWAKRVRGMLEFYGIMQVKVEDSGRPVIGRLDGPECYWMFDDIARLIEGILMCVADENYR